MLRAHELIALVFAALSSIVMACGGSCASQTQDNAAPAVEDPAPPHAARVSTKASGDPTSATIHHAAELANIDFATVERLDLALSNVDQVGHLAEHDAPSACRDLDLVRIAEAAPNLRWLRISGCPEAVHAGLSAFADSLEALELADLSLDGVTIGRLSQLRGLRELTLTRVRTGNDPLDPLGRLRLRALVLADLERDSRLSSMLDLWPRTLVEVQLLGNWAGHKAMLTLARAESLERLELRDTRVTNFSFHQIKTLSHVEEIALSGGTFNDSTPLYFRDLPLTRFACDCPRLGDGGLRALKRSDKLRVLELPRSAISGEGLATLSEIRNLEELVLEGGDIGAEGLSALGGIANLRRLELSGAMTAPAMPGLGDLTDLEVLRLDYDDLDDRIGSELSKLENLRELDLAGTQISDDGLAALAELGRLRVLKLGNTRVTNQGLEHLSKLVDLEVLELDHTDVVDAGIAHLSTLPNLRELRLGHTLVTDAGLEHLLGLENLERLDLEHTVVTAEGVTKLRALPRLTTVGLEGTRATTVAEG